jgi:hypothetical protein
MVTQGDVVAIRHTHDRYCVPYFLGAVRETPASDAAGESLRVCWLQEPAQSKSGDYTYTVDGWIDE